MNLYGCAAAIVAKKHFLVAVAFATERQKVVVAQESKNSKIILLRKHMEEEKNACTKYGEVSTIVALIHPIIDTKITVVEVSRFAENGRIMRISVIGQCLMDMTHLLQEGNVPLTVSMSMETIAQKIADG